MRAARALRRPGTALAGVVLALAGLGAAADLTAPVGRRGPVAATARALPVGQASAVCPDPAADGATQTRVSVAAPGLPADAARAASAASGAPPSGRGGPRGGVRLLRLRGGTVSAVPVAVPGAGAVLAQPGQGPLLARGTGLAAPGLTASMLSRSTADASRGLLGTTCAAPATDFWFVGSGSVVGQRGRVYLSNPAAAPAVVDLTLYGPDGPLEAPAGRGVTVAGGAQQVLLLDALAPGSSVLAVHVHARAGRVAAAVRDQQVDGLTPRGADWVPPAAAPARRQLVAGVTGGPGERVLQVVAPGASDAIVKVALLTATGAFTPAGLDVLEVKAGSVTAVDLASYTRGEPVAVALRSDVPVTAGLLARATSTAAGTLTDLAYTAAGRPVSPVAPGAVPEARTGPGLTSALLLAAPGAAATVRVAALPPATGTVRQVVVPARSQVVLDLATVSTAAAFAVTVEPLAGSGPVYAVRSVTEAEARGPLVSTEPVVPGRFTVSVPPVLADLSTVLPPGG